jgi:hypothetical protein
MVIKKKLFPFYLFKYFSCITANPLLLRTLSVMCFGGSATSAIRSLRPAAGSICSPPPPLSQRLRPRAASATPSTRPAVPVAGSICLPPPTLGQRARPLVTTPAFLLKLTQPPGDPFISDDRTRDRGITKADRGPGGSPDWDVSRVPGRQWLARVLDRPAVGTCPQPSQQAIRIPGRTSGRYVSPTELVDRASAGPAGGSCPRPCQRVSGQYVPPAESAS